MPAGKRLDAALTAEGLARSRTHAAALIAAGRVLVGGVVVTKPAARVDSDDDLTVTGAEDWVSRAAQKLIAGLDAFGVDVVGRLALDLGASTGGFTQVLRARGARPVIALDVGHGQLAPVVAADPDVIVVEGVNARYLTADVLAEASGTREAPRIVTGDLSFISLSHVLPAIAGLIAPTADVILLVKPQFEAGRHAVKGGLVTEPAVRRDAVLGVLAAAADAGLDTRGVIASPLPGTHGNREFVVHLTPGPGSDPAEWTDIVTRLAETQ